MSTRPGSARSPRELPPELLVANVFEFRATRVAKALQQIDRAIDGHFAQFDEALVRLQIGVQDFSGDVFGAMDHRL
jgi:hypothetical protein